MANQISFFDDCRQLFGMLYMWFSIVLVTKKARFSKHANAITGFSQKIYVYCTI